MPATRMETLVSATQFKARCLELLDEVAQTGRELVITKRKRPVARVVPVEPAASLRGSVRFLVNDDQLIAPLPEVWEAAAPSAGSGQAGVR